MYVLQHIHTIGRFHFADLLGANLKPKKKKQKTITINKSDFKKGFAKLEEAVKSSMENSKTHPAGRNSPWCFHTTCIADKVAELKHLLKHSGG